MLHHSDFARESTWAMPAAGATPLTDKAEEHRGMQMSVGSSTMFETSFIFSAGPPYHQYALRVHFRPAHHILHA